jgi:hypothetical protein
MSVWNIMSAWDIYKAKKRTKIWEKKNIKFGLHYWNKNSNNINDVKKVCSCSCKNVKNENTNADNNHTDRSQAIDIGILHDDENAFISTTT